MIPERVLLEVVETSVVSLSWTRVWHGGVMLFFKFSGLFLFRVVLSQRKYKSHIMYPMFIGGAK